MPMLGEQGVGAFIDAHYGKRGDHLFRMELLPTYRVDSDGDELSRWQGGTTEPTSSLKQPWLDTLAREHEAGLVS